MKPKLNPRSLPLALLTLAYTVMWLGGVGHYVIYGRPPLNVPWAASVFLLLAGLLVVVTSPKRDVLTLSLAAALGFLAEILGVRYGFIFSPYRYTAVLQPQVLGVPLVMLSAWLVLVAYCRQLLRRWPLPAWSAAMLGAAWMTAIDLVIDPLAANQLGYWRWEQASGYYGIPLHNFAGWFAVSLIVFLLVRRELSPNPAARYVGLSIVLFFTLIALSYGLWLAGGVGLLLGFTHCLAAGAWAANRNQRTKKCETEK